MDRIPLRLFPLLALAAIALLGCGGGHEQPPPWLRSDEKPRDENYHGGPAAMLMLYDTNHDGTLTRDEMVSGLKAEFAAHDVKHTGCLDDDQVADINQKRVEADQSTASPLIDWNHDGCIDYTEFSAAAYSLFDQLDRNNDGKLTPQEMGKRPAAKPGDQPSPDADAPQGRRGGGRRRGPGGGPPPEGDN